jgi:hypothetical protein
VHTINARTGTASTNICGSAATKVINSTKCCVISNQPQAFDSECLLPITIQAAPESRSSDRE